MEDFDKTLHNPTRLRVMSLLAQVEEAKFSTVRDMVDVSDPFLSKHLSTLRKAGYVELRKVMQDGWKRTWIKATGPGRTALQGHLRFFHKLIECAQIEVGSQNKDGPSGDSLGAPEIVTSSNPL